MLNCQHHHGNSCKLNFFCFISFYSDNENKQQARTNFFPVTIDVFAQDYNNLTANKYVSATNEKAT